MIYVEPSDTISVQPLNSRTRPGSTEYAVRLTTKEPNLPLVLGMYNRDLISTHMQYIQSPIVTAILVVES